MSVVVSVPSPLVDLVGPVDGAVIVPWDLTEAPARQDEIELVVVPPFGAPWVTRFAQLPALRSVVMSTAGYEHVLHRIPPGVALANAVGVHDTATAELALALILAAQRDLPDLVRDQDRRRWAKPQIRRGLADATVLLIGYGGIGQAVTRRLLACEAKVVAVASQRRPGDDLVEQVHGIEELADLLPTADVLLLAVPLSERTRALVDAQVLAALPDDALVVNVGRGPVVDTDALVAECAAGRLRAALDVTDPEPLPEDHPLWTTPGVLVSPHTGGATRAFPPRAAAYLRRQIEAVVATGALAHVVAVGGD